MQESVETAGEFVVARGDATELLEPIEETFNQMARLVAIPLGQNSCRFDRILN